ncbi:TKL/LISK/LISK-DD1 protein kinase [Saprolegnia diclina VS20]|uniref:TKL/LISK/LISK-DD1 protein kinase n=1 Tax=Saprolegnia diclina (strain VS20) TaxID=1156394 RepID=T0QX44_SAPDV|nr:TKL/LISK/LISK-DD1 protein kinase [Saprolegnia diclina VS20]EQC42814.1 TKL/LISK/LISK-DD1 protein kinase [Saprolegnia diclina VS20]|eukprot:XP_008604237.1 TKL/LISK/LISK-DD1 protein kinase [Saprolegnia diclina VS20]
MQRAVLMLASAAATDLSCPYLLSPYNVLTAGALCPASAIVCQVDNLCQVTWASVGSQYKLADIAGIGDLRQYSLQKLILQNSTTHLQFESNFQLPSMLAEFGIEHSLFRNVSQLDGITWPSLTALYLNDDSLERIPQGLPKVLAELWLDDNRLTTLDASLPTVSNVFSAERNAIRSIVNVNFRSAARIYLSGNAISSITNTTFGQGLTLLQCPQCVASMQLTISADSYAVLQSLGPYNASTNTGVNFGNHALTNSSSCDPKDVANTLFGQYPVCIRDAPGVTPATPTKRGNLLDDGLPTLWVVLLVLGVLVLLCCIFCCCFFCCRCHRAKEDSASSTPPSQAAPTPTHTNFTALEHLPAPSCPTNVTMPGVPYVQVTNTCNVIAALMPWQLPMDAITYSHVLSTGGHGHVWLGYYENAPVAIKTLRNVHSSLAQAAFAREIQLMTSLTSPHIVACIGVTWSLDDNDLRLVVEYMDQTDLREFLQKTNPISFPWSLKVASLTSVAAALQYLHARGIVHRDLKSKNILLDTVKGTKLMDFGEARLDAPETMTAGVGTCRWTAPEVLRGGRYSVAADIYSFGMVLAEMDAHNIPYALERDPSTGAPLVDAVIVTRVLQGTLRPVFSAACPTWLPDLALRCVDPNPLGRPTAADIGVLLRGHMTV